jgi:hypothetical protein
MKFGHIVHSVEHIAHEGLEITSHLGGAVGNASSTILDAGNAISDFHNHNIVGGIIESGEAIYHGVETYGDIVSGDYL